jgi:hypothetical protein
MMVNPKDTVVLIVQHLITNKYRLIELESPIANKLDEDECIVDSIEIGKSEPSHFVAFITTIRLQYGVDCRISICSGELGSYGEILYFEIRDGKRNKNFNHIQ